MITTSDYKAVYSITVEDLTDFEFNFSILQETDLLVQLVNQGGTLHDLELNADYIVTGTGNSEEDTTDYTSGTVIFGTSPLVGETVIIKLNVPITQEVDYIENSKFPANTHEKALDKLTLLIKQQQEQIDRSFKVDYTSQNFTDYTLPIGQPNYYIRFNSAGTGLEAVVGTPAASIEVELDPSPSLGGNLDTNGNEIISDDDSNVVIRPGDGQAVDLITDTVYIGQDLEHKGDSNTKLTFTPDAVSWLIGGVNIADYSPSGVRLGAANARVTTILDDGTMAAGSSTALVTQNSVRTYVTDYSVFKSAPVLGGDLDTASYNIVTTASNYSITIDPHGSGDVNLIADTGGIIDLASDIVQVGADIIHEGDTDTKVSFGTDTLDLRTGGSSRLDITNSGVRVGNGGARIINFSTDGTLAANSDTLVPTEKAIKTYIGTATTYADQSEMEAATANNRTVNPSVVQYHPGVAKFWCQINNVSPYNIISSHNIASISTISPTTRYRLTFTTPMSSANYVCVTSFKETSGTGTQVGISITDQTTTYIDIRTSNASIEEIYVVGFGDQ